MRVPDAINQLDDIRLKVTAGTAAWRQAVEEVLDAVWLEAYEEGLRGLFEDPLAGDGE